MKVIKSEYHIHFDVDDTLVMHYWADGTETRFVRDPYCASLIEIAPNQANIRLLIEKSRRGAYITVWSLGGWAWAEAVVRTLGLASFVHEVRTKPSLIVDDSPTDTWLPAPLWLAPNKKWKTHGR